MLINFAKLFLLFYFVFVFFLLIPHRYQLFLQVKQDVLQGRLPVTYEMATELGAYVIQCKFINLHKMHL